jgi:hypothetical protein
MPKIDGFAESLDNLSFRVKRPPWRDMRIITGAISAVAAIAAFSLRSFGEVGMAKSAYEPGLGQGEIFPI